ncbi:hypothetical protein BH11ACT6_BH11ACT6_48470 [soil metagenome]
MALGDRDGTPTAPLNSKTTGVVSSDLEAAVEGQGLQQFFQPIVALPNGQLVGFEALARWPKLGELTPESVLAYAASTDRGPQLERLCIEAAIESARNARLPAGSMVFVNSEAATPHFGRARDPMLARGAESFRLVFELTERSLLEDPPALLKKVAALRADGFAIALDDVGAQQESLALLDVLSPEVIKLDLALVQSQSRYQQARTWAAVLAHHESAGAVVLAEGIETAEHLQRALALGASLGQGFMFGHPRPLTPRAHGGIENLAAFRREHPSFAAGSPFDAVVGTVSTRVERKDTVLALSRYFEQQAADAIDPPMVLTALQRAEFFSGETRQRYHDLAGTSPLVVVFGHDVAVDLGSGVRGVPCGANDPLNSQWIVLTLGANTASALISRELDTDGQGGCPDGDRLFEVAITNDRALVTAAARSLLGRMSL